MAFLFCCLVVVCRFGGLECVVVEVSCRRGGSCSSHAAPASKAARRRRLSCRRSRSPHNVSWHPYPSGGWRPLFQGPPSNPLRVGAVSWGIVSKDRKGSKNITPRHSFIHTHFATNIFVSLIQHVRLRHRDYLFAKLFISCFNISACWSSRFVSAGFACAILYVHP